MDWVIRPVRSTDDFEAIGSIYAESWRAGYQGIVPQDYLDGLTAFRWARLLAGQTEGAFVVMEDDRYIGTSSYCPARDEAMSGWGEVISVYVLPEYFGKGCAGPLLAASVTALGGMGFDRIYLWVLAENARARRFYEKCGFRPSGESATITIGGADLEEVRYIHTGRGL